MEKIWEAFTKIIQRETLIVVPQYFTSGYVIFLLLHFDIPCSPSFFYAAYALIILQFL